MLSPNTVIISMLRIIYFNYHFYFTVDKTQVLKSQKLALDYPASKIRARISNLVHLVLDQALAVNHQLSTAKKLPGYLKQKLFLTLVNSVFFCNRYIKV